MTIVKNVLDQKGHDVHFIHPNASVFDALKMMAENNIGSLIVLEDGKLVGVITERHYAREIVLKGRTSPGTLVRDVMSTKVIYARPDQSEGMHGCNDRKSCAPPSGARTWTTSWYSFDWRHGEKRYQ
jgi:CBS domain-containing protein